MTIDEILNGLDLLAYEAEKQGHTQKEKILYAATAALRAGQAMRNCFNPIDDDDDSLWATDIKRSDLSVAGLAWDKAIRGDE
jgi:hypothetical protein